MGCRLLVLSWPYCWHSWLNCIQVYPICCCGEILLCVNCLFLSPLHFGAPESIWLVLLCNDTWRARAASSRYKFVVSVLILPRSLIFLNSSSHFIETILYQMEVMGMCLLSLKGFACTSFIQTDDGKYCGPHFWDYFRTKNVGIILWAHIVYQPTGFNIKGPCYRVHYFYWIENSVHSQDFQPQKGGGHDKCTLNFIL